MSEERDIVERLKERVVYDATHNPPADPLDAEAASEIQRLRGEVERLRGMITTIACKTCCGDVVNSYVESCDLRKYAPGIEDLFLANLEREG